MNVEIGAEAALFPEKEYINGIAVAVHYNMVEGGPGNNNYAQMEVMGEVAWRGPEAG